jgi:hypothetical protein
MWQTIQAKLIEYESAPREKEKAEPSPFFMHSKPINPFAIAQITCKHSTDRDGGN